MPAHLRSRAFQVHVWPSVNTDEVEPPISEQTYAFTSLHAAHQVMTEHGIDYADIVCATVADGYSGGEWFAEARSINGQLVYQPVKR